MRKDWTLDRDGGVLSCVVSDRTMSVDLTELFTDYVEYTALQQDAIAYGVKQKLADCTARSKDMTLSAQEQCDTMADRYRTLIDSQEWNEKGGGGGIAIASAALKKIKEHADQLTPELRAALEAAGVKF